MKRSSYIKRHKRPRRMSEKKRAELQDSMAFSRIVIEQANGRCERCRELMYWFDLHAHHRLPRSQGGTNDPDNGAALCLRCHRLVHDHGADGWSPWWNWIVTRNTLGKSA